MKKYLAWIPPLAWAILIWRLTTTPDFSVTSDSLLSFLISNGGHFIFFGIQATLLFLSLSSILYSIVLTSLYGLVIELVQQSIHGRTGDPIDWLLDTLGALTFLFLFKKLQSKL